MLFNLDLSGGCTGKIKEYNDRIPNKEKDILGETDEPEEDYDLMNVIVIRMGEKSEERGIFDYLNQIFVGNIEEIETYSHIEWEEEFKEDVAMTMTGFSDVLVRRGREEGRI